MFTGTGYDHMHESAFPLGTIDRGTEELWNSSGKSETILALGREHMVHNHGNEYQLKIVHEDGTEDLSGWMSSTDQVAQAMTAVHRPQGKACWLLIRNILCPNCSDKEQIMEYPIMHIPSPRYMPHDSGYLQVVESRNRYALGFSAQRHTP